MQHFRIDDFLKKRNKALQSLVQAGSAHYNEVQDYVKAQQLYEEALQLHRHDLPRLKVMHGLFGEHLQSQSKYSEAGLSRLFCIFHCG
jgi:elongator complex protein 1